MSEIPTLEMLAKNVETQKIFDIYNQFQRMYKQKHYKEYVNHFENNTCEEYFIQREKVFDRYARINYIKN